MAYIHTLLGVPSFKGKGLIGYTFGPLRQKDIEIYYVEVGKGHDFFMISKKITRTYYILTGSGYFIIDGNRFDVCSGNLIEVPPKLEYCYSGEMTLIAISQPRWFRGNDTFTKWNPDVVGKTSMLEIAREPLLKKLVQSTVFGKSPTRAWLRLNHRLWGSLPHSVTSLRPARAYGDFLHSLARMQEVRSQAFATLFLRNRPQLELIKRLISTRPTGDTLRVAILGCSAGAEAYSVSWRIRSARPDVKLELYAVDISKRVVEFAMGGVYSLDRCELTGTHIFECMTSDEMNEMFLTDGDSVAVRPWIKEGIKWHVGDAGNPELIKMLGSMDIVIANNFLCHMESFEAEMCLRNIADLVKPTGFLIVSGIDLDVRTKVARNLGWLPVQNLLEEIHDGDSYLRGYWPGYYAGLEPLDKKKRNWKLRYAATFQLLDNSEVECAP